MKSRVARGLLLAAATLALAISSGCQALAQQPPPAAQPGGGAKLAIDITPATAEATPGETVRFTVHITRKQLSGPIGFTVAGLPSHASASFSPAQPTAAATTLTVVTATPTAPGAYPLTVRAAAGPVSASDTARLTVVARPQPFTVTGNLDRKLAPGQTGYLNLSLSNPNRQTLKVTSIVVTISRAGTAACSASANFTVVQYAGHYPLTIPAQTSRSLAQLGIPQSHWPRITMADLRTNQDACKNATLQLTYTGTGYGQ